MPALPFLRSFLGTRSFFCIPQANKEAQGRAISSIASYVRDAAYFFVSRCSPSTSKVATCARRGWSCMGGVGWVLGECLFGSRWKQKPLIVVESPSAIYTHGPGGIVNKEWINNPVGLGNFTVQDDAELLGPVIQRLVGSGMAAAKAAGPPASRALCLAAGSSVERATMRRSRRWMNGWRRWALRLCTMGRTWSRTLLLRAWRARRLRGADSTWRRRAIKA